MIGPADEARHPVGGGELWGESWYFDFALPDGSFGGYVRLGLYPNQNTAWWWTYLCGDDRPLVTVRDHEVPLPGPRSLEIRTEGLWADLNCETPHEHWSIGMEAFGLALDDPADAYHGERGMRVAVGLDLEWEATSPVYEYPGAAQRYEQACEVHGEVLIGDERLEITAVGERDHSWGTRDWWAFPWCWTAGQLAGGPAFHASRILLPGTDFHAGFVADGQLREIDHFTVDTTTGDEDLPTSASMALGPLELEVTPLHHAPVLLVAPDGRVGRFPRALCRFTSADGPAGVGWTEWNQPPPPPPG